MAGQPCLTMERWERRILHPRLQSLRGPNPRHGRLARCPHILDHSRVLASHSSPRSAMALLSALALSRAYSHVGWYVDRYGRDHLAMAPWSALLITIHVDSGSVLLCRRLGTLQNWWPEFHRGATRRTSGTRARPPRTEVSDLGRPRPCAAPHLSRTFLRTAGMEHWNGIDRRVRAHRLRSGHRRPDDSHGR